MSAKPIEIIKETGEKALYDAELLKTSLKRSGAKDEIVNEIVSEIEENLYHGITTKKIYGLAFRLLRKSSKSKAARYKLKKAIFELGPTGYPFEKFVGALLGHSGFYTQTGVTANGKCITHEIDVVANKGDEITLVECKFHINPESNTDVKVPLYIHSRFRDVEETLRLIPENANKKFNYWIVTNTRFSSDALKYSECAGITLVSWDYPKNKGLRKMIDQSGFHPITSLSTLSKTEKNRLLALDVVLCIDLVRTEDLLKKIGIPVKKIAIIMQEAKSLCEPCN